MSADTLFNLENALQAHFKDEWEQDFISNWVVIAAGVSADSVENNQIVFADPDSQPSYVTIGLLKSGLMIQEGWVYSAMEKE